MEYTVLARKYRSWTFDELVGQEAIATTLKNAITSGRLHHGYLFCGTRGVGKTSTARILARSLNCLRSEGPTVQPCCECESCLRIAEGQDVDVIEIDAASNTGVDDVRVLRGNTAYRPARSRYKIYIIDEVHMLSTAAFNALLKTLEEPPGHVKFIMATTEAQKVPATIQSRCLRFDFRSMSVDAIAGHFAEILKKEGVEADPAVLRRVARLANGSMRDGLSLLDQLLSSGTRSLTVEMVDDVLPTQHDETITRLIGQLADRDAAGALVGLDACLSGGYSLDRFVEALGEQLRTLMVMSVCGASSSLVDLPGGAVAEQMAALSTRFSPESYTYMISVLEELRRNVRNSALGRPLVEAALVRLAAGASYASIQTLLESLDAGGGPAVPAVASAPAARPAASPPARPAPAAAPAPAPPRPAAPAQRAPAAEPPAPSQPTPAPAPAPAGKQAAKPAKPTEAQPAPKPGRRSGAPSPEEMKAVMSDPVVQKTLELFDGTIVHVERPPKK